MVYLINDEQYINILNLLEQVDNGTYLNSYSDWLKVLTVFKTHNKCEICDALSKKSPEYKENKNTFFYDRVTSIIDINYLVNVIRRNNIVIKY